jgi:hypothetical protein
VSEARLSGMRYSPRIAEYLLELAHGTLAEVVAPRPLRMVPSCRQKVV